MLGIELAAIMKMINVDTLIFLGDSKTSWLYQDNSYKPVKEALNFLVDNKVGKRFNGALLVDDKSLAVFVRHLSWLTRCNASLPNFHFSDNGQNFVGNICKYGNIHLDTLNKRSDKLIEAAIEKSKFELLSDNVCKNNFGATSAIPRRQIVI